MDARRSIAIRGPKSEARANDDARMYRKERNLHILVITCYLQSEKENDPFQSGWLKHSLLRFQNQAANHRNWISSSNKIPVGVAQLVRALVS